MIAFLLVSIELGRFVAEHIGTLLPEFVGGFVAYVLHQTYHEIWKRPAHRLIRLVFRRGIRSR